MWFAVRMLVVPSDLLVVARLSCGISTRPGTCRLITSPGGVCVSNQQPPLTRVLLIGGAAIYHWKDQMSDGVIAASSGLPLTWFDFNSSMDKQLHPLWSVIYKIMYPFPNFNFFNLSFLGLKLIHVSKSAPNAIIMSPLPTWVYMI